MTITFFNDKPQCGKSTLTIHTAKMLANFFKKEGDRKVYVFDTSREITNSLYHKKEQEELSSIIEKTNLYIDFIDDFSEFEVKKIDYDIQKDDVVFFDLQGLQNRQLDFLFNSNFIFIVSNSPNELEGVDREIYDLIMKVKDNPLSVSQVRKIFLTQNGVREAERIVKEFEDIDYIDGLPKVSGENLIENMFIYKNTNVPPFIQKFSIDVWKKVKEYKEQIILN
jgi:hypothetical protein